MLYICPVHAAVELLYLEGRLIKPQYPPLVGQLMSGHERDAPVLYLWPLDWVRNTTHPQEPLAMLWRPVLLGISHSDVLLSGLEARERSGNRHWYAQKWKCGVLTAQLARDFFKWDSLKTRELESAMPPSPAPADPENPFS